MSFGLTQQVLWYRCWGLINSPWVAMSLACVHVLVGSTSFMAPLPGVEGIKEILLWTFLRKRTKIVFQAVAIFSH